MEIKYTNEESVKIESRLFEKQFDMTFLEIHDFYEVYYLLSGERKYFIEDTIYKIEAGDVVFVPPNVLHRSLTDGEGRYSRIHIAIPSCAFEEEMLSEFESAFNGYILKIPSKRKKFFEQILEKMEYEYNKNDSYSEYLINNAVNELLVFLLRVNKGMEFQPSEIESDRIISQAAYFIRMNHCFPITLDEVASEVGMSRTYFSKLFKRKTGFGFSDYLAGVRITEAAQLLTETDMDITSVATRCGYSDSSYFAAVFKKIKGVTPIKYRKASRT